MKRYLFFLLIISLSNCFVLNEAGMNAFNDINGSESKKLIANAIQTAEVSALNIYLANNGMSGGITAIASLVVVNGLLAQKLYPYVSKIEDGSYYSKISVLQCVEDIKTKGAISLGLSYSELPSSGLGGPLRDAALLPEFASCELEKSESFISVPKVIDL